MDVLSTGLAVLITVLSVCAVTSAVILVRVAFIKPRIGALTERAIIAVFLAFFGIVSTIVVTNTELGRALFSTEISKLVNRAAVVGLLSVPTYWLWLYLTGRLGGRE